MALPPPSEPKPTAAGTGVVEAHRPPPAAAHQYPPEEELTEFQRKMLELMEKKKEEAERKVGSGWAGPWCKHAQTGGLR